jgi:AraC family transcriptional regulator
MPQPAPRYQGDFVAWQGGCGFLGMGGAGAIDTHSHHSIQLAFAAPDGLKVRFGRLGAFEHCAGALVPSKAPHTVDLAGCDWSAVLFIDPETTEGRAIAAQLDGKLRPLDAALIAPMAKKLENAWRAEADAGKVGAICEQLVRDLARASSREPADPRVLAVVDHIRRRVDHPITLGEAAAMAGLSPSRFRHVFVAETGMPLRTYVLWRRLLHVWTLLMQGETLAGAAHGAGFADSAHLSRTSRTMFGLPPSAMQASGPLSARMKAPQRHFG